MVKNKSAITFSTCNNITVGDVYHESYNYTLLQNEDFDLMLLGQDVRLSVLTLHYPVFLCHMRVCNVCI